MLSGISPLSVGAIAASAVADSANSLQTSINKCTSSAAAAAAGAPTISAGTLPMTDSDLVRWQGTLAHCTEAFAKLQLSAESVQVLLQGGAPRPTSSSSSSSASEDASRAIPPLQLLGIFDPAAMPPPKQTTEILKIKNRWLQHRQRLAVYDKRVDLLKNIRASRAIVVCGDAMSGKSTQVPFLINDSDVGKKKRLIIVRPSVFSAAELAARLKEELEETASHFVDTALPTNAAGPCHMGAVIVVTVPEVLLRTLAAPESAPLANVGAIIIDEAQERTAAGDLLLFHLKHLLAQQQQPASSAAAAQQQQQQQQTWKLVLLARNNNNSNITDTVPSVANFFAQYLSAAIYSIPRLAPKSAAAATPAAADGSAPAAASMTTTNTTTAFLEAAAAWGVLGRKKKTGVEQDATATTSLRAQIDEAAKAGQTSLEVRSLLQTVDRGPAVDAASNQHRNFSLSGAAYSFGEQSTTTTTSSSSSRGGGGGGDGNTKNNSNNNMQRQDDDEDDEDSSPGFASSWAPLLTSLIRTAASAAFSADAAESTSSTAAAAAAKTVVVVHLPSVLHARCIATIIASRSDESSARLRVAVCDPDSERIQYVDEQQQQQRHQIEEQSPIKSPPLLLLLVVGTETVLPYSIINNNNNNSSNNVIFIDSCRSLFLRTEYIAPMTAAAAAATTGSNSAGSNTPPQLVTVPSFSFSSPDNLAHRCAVARALNAKLLVQLVSAASTGSSSSVSAHNAALVSGGGSAVHMPQHLAATQQQLVAAIALSADAFSSAASASRSVRTNLTAQQRNQQAAARSALLLHAPINRCTPAQMAHLALLHSLLLVYGPHRSALLAALAAASPVLAVVPPPAQGPSETQLQQRQLQTWLGRAVACLPPLYVLPQQTQQQSAVLQTFCQDALAWAIPARLVGSGCLIAGAAGGAAASSSVAGANRTAPAVPSSSGQQQQHVTASAIAAASRHNGNPTASEITSFGFACAMSPFPLAVTRLLLFGTVTGMRSQALVLASLLLGGGSVFRSGVAEGLSARRFFAANFPGSDIEAELRALKLYYTCLRKAGGNNNKNDVDGHDSAKSNEQLDAFLSEGVVSLPAIKALETTHARLGELMSKMWWQVFHDSSAPKQRGGAKGPGATTAASSAKSNASNYCSLAETICVSEASFDQELQRHSIIRFLLTAAAYPDVFVSLPSADDHANNKNNNNSAASSLFSSHQLECSKKYSAVSGKIINNVAALGGLTAPNNIGHNISPSGTVASMPFSSCALALVTVAGNIPSSKMISVTSASINEERHYKEHLAAAAAALNKNSNHNKNSASSHQHQQQQQPAVVVGASMCRGWWGAVTNSWRTTSLAAASNVVSAQPPSLRLDPVPATLFDSLQQPCAFAKAEKEQRQLVEESRNNNTAEQQQPLLSNSIAGLLPMQCLKFSDIAIATLARINHGIYGAATLWLEETAAAKTGGGGDEAQKIADQLGDVLRWAARREAGAAGFLRERRRTIGRNGTAVTARTKLIPLRHFSLADLALTSSSSSSSLLGGGNSMADIRAEKTTTAQCLSEVSREDTRLKAATGVATLGARETALGSAMLHGGGGSRATTAAAAGASSTAASLPFFGQQPTDPTTVTLIRDAASLVARSGSRVHEAVLLDTAGREIFAFFEPKHQYHGYYLYQLKKASAGTLSIFGDDVVQLKAFMKDLELAIRAEDAAAAVSALVIPAPYTKEEAEAALSKQKNKSGGGAASSSAAKGSTKSGNEDAAAAAAKQKEQQQQKKDEPRMPDHPPSSSAAAADAASGGGSLLPLPPPATMKPAPGGGHHKIMTRVIVVQAEDERPAAPSVATTTASSGGLLPAPVAPESAATGSGVLLPQAVKGYSYPTHEIYYRFGADPYNRQTLDWLEAQGAFRHITDPNYSPLTTLPPPIYFDSTVHFRPHSVIVSPVPEPPRQLRDPIPMVLANSLGEFLGTKVGPTTIVGDTARIEVPNAAVEARALALKSFMCLGKKLVIEANDRMFDNRAIAERLASKRNYIRSKLQDSHHDHLTKVEFDRGVGYVVPEIVASGAMPPVGSRGGRSRYVNPEMTRGNADEPLFPAPFPSGAQSEGATTTTTTTTAQHPQENGGASVASDRVEDSGSAAF